MLGAMTRKLLVQRCAQAGAATAASLALGLAAAGSLAAGCTGSGNPDFQEATQTFFLAYCEKLKVCAGDTEFTRLYPRGVQQCADQYVQTYHTISQLESVCSREQWSACAADLKSGPGPDAGGCRSTPPIDGGDGGSEAGTTSKPVLPASCLGC
jgi:hypothetical protein